MKKKLLTILLPLVITIACCSLAVWANEQETAQTPCGNCAKHARVSDAHPCPPGADCPLGAKAAQGCEKCAQMKVAQATPPCGNQPCDKCAKAQQVEKPCCAKGAKDQQAVKPCCDKAKAE